MVQKVRRSVPTQADSVGHKRRRPSHQHRHDTQCQPLVPLRPAETDELHTPMQGTEERQDDGSVGDLDRLEVVQERSRRFEVDPGESVTA